MGEAEILQKLESDISEIKEMKYYLERRRFNAYNK